MRAFVTGGTGFVGSHLVEELLSRGAEVRALVRSDPKWLAGLPVDLVSGDLADVEALGKWLEGVDAVYHVGGLTRARTEAELNAANVTATQNLLDASSLAGVSRFLVTSSQAAGGPSQGEPIDETAPMQPLTAYGRSKAAMEELVAAHELAPRSTIIRPPSVYGPRERDIFTAIRTAARQRVFPVVGDSRSPALALVHVKDLVRGMVDAAGAESAAGDTYYLTGPRDYSWDELRQALEKALGHAVLRIPLPTSLVGPAGALVEGAGRLVGVYPPFNREKAIELRRQWLASSARAAASFGYEPRIDIEEGMRDTVQWYRSEGWL
jgi:nucleoside-diphosphate-sugar epimerase